jgi:hypothetical protein
VGLLAVLLVVASGAYADTISIGLQENGGSISTVATGTPGAGFASYAGVYGDFSFNSITGEGSPNVPEPSLYSSSFNAQSSSTTGNVLRVYITEQGLTTTGVASFLSSFTSQAFTGAIASVQELTFINSGNGLYGGTQMASAIFYGAGATSSAYTPASLTGPYSETVEYIVTTNGIGSVNDTIDITAPTPSGPTSPAPESSTLLQTGLGIGSLLLFVTKRRLSIA